MLLLNDLTFRLGPRLLLDNTSASIPDRARVGFVGRNGTGKTTLFNLISGELSLEGGSIAIPRGLCLGRVEQEAPGGPGRLIDFVLMADLERAALLDEAEHAHDPHRISEIQLRLIDIEAHAAPARAAEILAGLGFDEAAQNRALSEFSGGWRMRVALAAVLFAKPDLLLLDEPTNYLDLEGTLWLVDYLTKYPATIIVISHDRDLLDDVSDHILHLEQAKLTLWRGNYTSFEKQRHEAQAILVKQKKKQDDKRKHMQAFVDRFRAQATKARQAQSRLKMLARMTEIGSIVDTDVQPFHLPSPHKQLSPPIIAMDRAAAGYDGRIVLRGLNLSISNDDRIGLLGANGNGKSTFAKLVAGRLSAMEGTIVRAPKISVGFFAQHQIDEFDEGGTPYTHVAPLMKDASEAKIRARCAQMGFSAQKADTNITKLSGGEKARLLMGLATFHGPHLLIMDEPTNHLDIDSRAALIEAINEYEGAIILVSHDRYLLEATADRLWLVQDGSVHAFDGDMDDYRRTVLQGSAPKSPRKKRRAAAAAPAPVAQDNEPALSREGGASRKQIEQAEKKLRTFEALLAKVDGVLAQPGIFRRDPAKAKELTRQRGELASALGKAEDEWLQLSAAAE